MPVVTIEVRLIVTRGALSEFTTLEVRANGEVWVQFQNFETGKAHKVAVS